MRKSCQALLAALCTHAGAALLIAPSSQRSSCLAAIQDNDESWTTLGNIATISTPWMTLLGERLLDHQGQELEYWRVEKGDSAVILTLHRNEWIFPQPIFRPGVGRSTLDFPGGRVPKTKQPSEVVPMILERELDIDPATDIISIQSLNDIGAWIVTFSSIVIVFHLQWSVPSDS
jgi:hypothetical protein